MLRGRAQSIIYSNSDGTVNPYEKLRVKIEPTRLAVMVDPVEHVPSSPVSSHNGSQHGVGGHEGGFSAFVRGARSHGGSSADCSQSPTESPMQSWSRGGNGGLPAMAPLPPHMGSGGNGGGNGGGLGGGIFGQGFDSGGGFDASSGMGGALGGLGGMGGGSGAFGGNGLLPQQQQQQQQQTSQQQQQQPSSSATHSSPMRPGYYGGSNSFGSTPVF